MYEPKARKSNRWNTSSLRWWSQSPKDRFVANSLSHKSPWQDDQSPVTRVPRETSEKKTEDVGRTFGQRPQTLTQRSADVLYTRINNQRGQELTRQAFRFLTPARLGPCHHWMGPARYHSLRSKINATKSERFQCLGLVVNGSSPWVYKENQSQNAVTVCFTSGHL